MSYEEEFDKIIRQKAGEADYPFNEDNWVKTSQMIDAERGAARKLFWKKFYVPAAIVGGIAVTALVTYGIVSSGANEKIAQNSVTINDKAVLRHADVHEKASGIISSSLNNGHTAESGAPEEKTDAKENLGASASVVPVTPDAIAVNISSDVQKTEDSQTASHVDNVIAKLAADELTAANNREKHADKIEPLKADATAGLNKGSEALSQGQNKVDIAEQPAMPAESVPAKDPHNDFNGVEMLASSEILSVHGSVLPDISNEREAVLSPLQFLKRYEDEYYTRKARTHFMNIEAGGTYDFGWNAVSGRDGKGINWFGGVNYGYYLCNKTSIGIGLQVYNFSNVNEEIYQNTKKDYGFGFSNTVTTITVNDLYYAAVPLKLAYHPTGSTYFGVGLNTGYAFYANSTQLVESYQISDELVGKTKEGKITHTTSVYENVRSLNLMGSLFFNTHISRKTAVNAEFIYGFTDIFKSTTVQNAEKPIGIRLSLQYYLFDK
jgi:hypothetical protein